MPRPKGSKNKDSVFNEMGIAADTPQGEPNPDAISPPATMEVDLDAPANKISATLRPLDATEKEGDLRTELINLLRTDKDMALLLLDSVTQTPEGRDLLNLAPGQGAAIGHYERNYDKEAHLRVTGGLEVKHPPGFKPLPPSFISMYKAPNDMKTSNEEEAIKDANGEPILTQDYKHYLDMKHAGRHLDGKVQSDMSVGSFGQETGDSFAAADGLLSE